MGKHGVQRCLAERFPTGLTRLTGQVPLEADRVIDVEQLEITPRAIRLEAGDGGPYATPLAQPLVDVLRDLGWNSPDDNFRNCWLQPPAEALESAARIAVLTTVTAFGYPEPPALP